MAAGLKAKPGLREQLRARQYAAGYQYGLENQLHGIARLVVP